MHSLKRLLSCLGLPLAAFLIAANSSTADAKKAKVDPAKDGWLYHCADDTHHIRLKIDKTNNEIRALMLDGTAGKIQPVDSKAIKLNVLKAKPAVELLLKARPDKNDGQGKSSVFVAKADALPRNFDKKNVELLAEIDGKLYSFRFDVDSVDGK